jgi:phage-related baseplate assembly protein
MSANTLIDLSQLDPPDIVETIDFETILAERKAKLVSLYPADEQAEIAATLELESEPIVMILEENAYREVVLRQRINDAARAVMLAYAKGNDLTQLAANYDVERLTITPADDTTVPPTAAVMEEDSDLRLRVQLSPESYTTAGSTGSYESAARGADADLKDVQVLSPTPGTVVVYVLSHTGDGTAGDTLIGNVKAALSADDVRPLTDNVDVRAAVIEKYSIVAELVMYSGPDTTTVADVATTKAQTYADSVQRIGADVAQSGIFQALHQPGVKQVNLIEPAANLVIDDGTASYCTSITLTTRTATDG